MIFLIIGIWAFGTLLVWGWMVACFQQNWVNYPSEQKARLLPNIVKCGILASLYGLIGPIGVLLGWALTDGAKYGWMTFKRGQ